MIRTPSHTYLSAEYEVFDGDQRVGYARVEEGTIISLCAQTDLDEAFHGQVLSELLRAICVDANKATANLSMMVPDEKTMRLQRFLEQFRFRQTHRNIFKRTAGAAIPPSVIF